MTTDTHVCQDNSVVVTNEGMLTMSDDTPTPEEIWKILKEFGEGLKETRQLLDNLGKKWGDMGEALTIGDALPVFKAAGIEVRGLHNNVYGSRGGDNWEIDGIAVGDDEVVVIEAKADMKTGHVSTFIDKKLKRFTELEPELAVNKRIYGAVGYLKASPEAISLAHKHGLMVIRSLHHTKELVEPPDSFELRDYHPRNAAV